jgi:hypothetical protein
MLGRQRNDQLSLHTRPGAADHDHAAVRDVRESREGALDLARIAHIDGAQLHAKRGRERLDRAKLGQTWRDGSVTKDRRSRYARRDLLEQLQPFPAEPRIISSDMLLKVLRGV